ncbi:hypothetical protein ACFVSW_05420 [Neobacillus sp. NPDC058068]
MKSIEDGFAQWKHAPKRGGEGKAEAPCPAATSAGGSDVEVVL